VGSFLWWDLYADTVFHTTMVLPRVLEGLFSSYVLLGNRVVLSIGLAFEKLSPVVRGLARYLYVVDVALRESRVGDSYEVA
ncbi:uncharacterized protein METZ01_LOCUS424915, partial [marine metagenome]